MGNKTYWFIEASKHVPKIKMGYVYVLQFEKWYKIGITNNLVRRYNALRFAMPTDNFKMIGFTACEYNGNMENGILMDLIQHKTRGEWIECSEDQLMEVINHWCGFYNVKFISENG